MRLPSILLLTLLASALHPRAALAQSGTQITADGKRALVSKDIGGQRWAISRNPDRSVTGNVFFPGGGAPQFVFCTETASSATDVTLSCSGADACPLATCESDEWLFIADVTLPVSFFGEATASARAVGGGMLPPGSAPGAVKYLSARGPASAAAVATPASGIQITPDGSIALISKDVGDQRWAISRNDDGTVTGNVFFPGGGPPQFVWCEPSGTAADPVALRCLGASACAVGAGGCTTADWTLIAEVSLPASFFRARESVSLDSLISQLLVRFGEDGAFDAVARALDRGYSLRQLVRATLSGRLQPSGVILERGGASEAPAGPSFGLFVTAAAAGERPLGTSGISLDKLREILGADSGKVAVLLLADLARVGYDIDQIVTALLIGNGRIRLFDPVELLDSDGTLIPPRRTDSGVIASPTPTFCGNGTRELGEGCDGADFGVTTCDSLQLPEGTLRCNVDCTLDASGCTGVCGNGRQEGTEECDGTRLGGETCLTLGFQGGTLACDGDCRIDSRGCTSCSAGGAGCCPAGQTSCNGTCVPAGSVCCPPGNEACGPGCMPSGADCCSGQGLYCDVGLTCVEGGCCPQAFPQVCNGQCLAPGASCCGNGNIEAGEECDGADVGGASCPALGSVRCTASCRLDFSGCESRCPAGAFECGNSCAPNGADCCDGTSVFCDGGDVCAFGGGGAVCCPGAYPTFCAGTCYPAGVVCCGSYACAAGSSCLGNNQCGG